MFKFLTIIALIASIGQSDASVWQRIIEGASGVAGMVFRESHIRVVNESGYPIRVGTSEEGQGIAARIGTLVIKGFSGGYDVVASGGGANYKTNKDSGMITVAAQYHEGWDISFTYCRLDTSKASHLLVFKNDGIGGRLYCHDKTL